MRIEQATAFLYALKPRGIRFGLENTRLVLQALGRPQERFRTVHVAGSNGKGSSCACLDALLRAGGARVGLYTSPHLVHFRERFMVDGRSLSDEAIAAAAERLLTVGLGLELAEVLSWIEAEDMVTRMVPERWTLERGGASRFTRLTFFECTTVLACLLFAEAGVEWAVMETGMGGRLDATNVLAPQLCALTPIHLEHTQWLGDSLAEIAAEKAGILKPGVPAVCARQHPEARAVVVETAAGVGAPLFWEGEDFEAEGDWRRAHLRAGGVEFGPLRLGLAGAYQLQNAALAAGCLPHLSPWPPPPGRVEVALAGVRWPGRFERFGPQGEWLLDGAHNPDGMRSLVATVREAFGQRPLRLLFGVLGDKDVGPMLAALDPLADAIGLVRSRDSRARDPSDLLARVGKPARVLGAVEDGMAALAAEPGPPVLVTGSLTVVGEARAWLENRGVVPSPAEVWDRDSGF